MVTKLTRVERIDQYRKLKASIREDSEQLLVGIDIGKSYHAVAIGNCRGRVFLERKKVSNSSARFEELHRIIEATLSQETLTRAVCAVEATGDYHKALAWFLFRQGYAVVQVSTIAAKYNRQTLDVSWDKNDQKDARNVLDLLTQGKVLYNVFEDEHMGNGRCLIRQLWCYRKDRNRLMNRCRNNLLPVIFPELDKLAADICHPDILALLEKYPTPAEICAVDETTFLSVSPSRHRSRVSRLRKIYQAAQNSIGCPVGEAFRQYMQDWVTEMREAHQRVQNQTQRVENHFCSLKEYQNLLTIPGIGPLLAAVIVNEIGDPRCYRKSNQIIKLAGLDLAGVQTGNFTGRLHISRRGRARLRWAAYQASLVAVAHDPTFKRLYQRALANRLGAPGQKMGAIVKVMDKLLRVAFQVMRKNNKYDKALVSANQS